MPALAQEVDEEHEQTISAGAKTGSAATAVWWASGRIMGRAPAVSPPGAGGRCVAAGAPGRRRGRTRREPVQRPGQQRQQAQRDPDDDRVGERDQDRAAARLLALEQFVLVAEARG